ncbi:MAG: alpha/beta hydrolase, partial [Myxococcales bacterium]|nr:alpha/beta hydrolase [Myxococcales bacterium]
MVSARTLALALPLWAAACIDADALGTFLPPTADEDPALPQIELEVAGHRRALHLETHGDPQDPAIFVLHGSLADFRALRPLAELADDGFFVVLWDQRGNGLSERVGADEIGEGPIVEEIAALKRRFSPAAPITLVGHSFGAMYAALYASRAPQDVEGLVLLEPAGLTGEIFTETFDEVFELDLFDPSLARTYWQTQVLGPLDHEQLDLKALMLLHSGSLLHYFCDPDELPPLPVWRPGAYLDLVRNQKLQPHRAGRFEYDYAAGLLEFSPPVLLLGSECSALGYEFQRRHHAPLLREVSLVRIDDAGHRLMVEQTDAVLDAIREYLRRLHPELGSRSRAS